MSFQSVGAGRGIEWIKAAVDVVMKNPVAFLVMALIFGLIMVIPVVGSIAVIVFGPALMGGMVYATKKQAEGGTAEIGDLFAAFQQQNKLGPMVLLCLPGIAAGVLGAVLGFVLLGGAILGGAASAAGGSDAAALASLGGGFALFFLVMLLIALAVYATVVFAIPRVMLDNLDAVAAMKESLSASLANIGALLVYCLVMFVVYLVSMILLIIPILGWIAWFVVLLGLVAANSSAVYFAYRDIFPSAGGSMAAPPAPPAPPM
jgi:uncharacterized membrane protein